MNLVVIVAGWVAVLLGGVESSPYWGRPDTASGGWVPLHNQPEPNSNPTSTHNSPIFIQPDQKKYPESFPSQQNFRSEEPRTILPFLHSLEPIPQPFLQRQIAQDPLFPPLVKQQNLQPPGAMFGGSLVGMNPQFGPPQFNYNPHPSHNVLNHQGPFRLENTYNPPSPPLNNPQPPNYSEEGNFNKNYFPDIPNIRNSSLNGNQEKEEIQILYVPVEMLREKENEKDDQAPNSKSVPNVHHYDEKHQEETQNLRDNKKFQHPIQTLRDEAPINQLRNYQNLRPSYYNKDVSNSTDSSNYKFGVQSASPAATFGSQPLKQTVDGYKTESSFNREHKFRESTTGDGETALSEQRALEELQYQTKPQPYPHSQAQPHPVPVLPPPNQPPLSVYMESTLRNKLGNILDLLKDTKTIPVIDSAVPDTPEIFVGPSNLDTPRGYVKFELPYLSSLHDKINEHKLSQVPFFVAPLNFQPPEGFSKIPFPPPHIGSVVLSNRSVAQKIQKHPQVSVETQTTGYSDPFTIPADISSISPQLPSLINSLQEEEQRMTPTTEGGPEESEPTEASTVPQRRPTNRRQNYRGSSSYSSTTRKPASRQRKPYNYRHFNQKASQQSGLRGTSQEIDTHSSLNIGRQPQEDKIADSPNQNQNAESPLFTPKIAKHVDSQLYTTTESSQTFFNEKQTQAQTYPHQHPTQQQNSNQFETFPNYESYSVPNTRGQHFNLEPFPLGHMDDKEVKDPEMISFGLLGDKAGFDEPESTPLVPENNYKEFIKDLPKHSQLYNINEQSGSQSDREKPPAGEQSQAPGPLPAPATPQHPTGAPYYFKENNFGGEHQRFITFPKSDPTYSNSQYSDRTQETIDVKNENSHYLPKSSTISPGYNSNFEQGQSQVGEKTEEIGDERSHTVQENRTNLGETSSPNNYETSRDNKESEERQSTVRFRSRVRGSSRTRGRDKNKSTTEASAVSSRLEESDKHTYPGLKKKSPSSSALTINQESELNSFNQDESKEASSPSPQANSSKKQTYSRTRRPHRTSTARPLSTNIPGATKYLIRRKPTVGGTTRLQAGRQRIRRPTTATTSTTAPTTSASSPEYPRTLPGSWPHSHDIATHPNTNHNLKLTSNGKFYFDPSEYRDEELGTSKEPGKDYSLQNSYLQQSGAWQTSTEGGFYPRGKETISGGRSQYDKEEYPQQTTPGYSGGQLPEPTLNLNLKSQPHPTRISDHSYNPFSDNYQPKYQTVHRHQTPKQPKTNQQKIEQYSFNDDTDMPKTPQVKHQSANHEHSDRNPNHSYDGFSDNFDLSLKAQISRDPSKNSGYPTTAPNQSYDSYERSDEEVQSPPETKHKITKNYFNKYSENFDQPESYQGRYPSEINVEQMQRQTGSLSNTEDLEQPQIAQKTKSRTQPQHNSAGKQRKTTPTEESSPGAKKNHFGSSSEKPWTEAVTIQQSESYVYMPQGGQHQQYSPEVIGSSESETNRNNTQYDYDDYFNFQGNGPYTSDQSPFPSNEQQVATYEKFKEGLKFGKDDQYVQQSQVESSTGEDYSASTMPNPDKNHDKTNGPRYEEIGATATRSQNQETLPKEVNEGSSTNPGLPEGSKGDDNPVIGDTKIGAGTQPKVSKRRGMWVRVRVKKPKEFFETAESQRVGLSIENSVKDNLKTIAKPSESHIAGGNSSHNSQFKINEKNVNQVNNVNRPNSNIGSEADVSKEHLSDSGATVDTEDSKNSSAGNTNQNHEKEVTTENKTVSSQSQMETTTIAEETDTLKVFNISTTTEISLETEICYKGQCIKTKNAQESENVKQQ